MYSTNNRPILTICFTSMESLRVMPPVPLTVRVAAKTEYIDGVLIPKGTLFWIPVRSSSLRSGTHSYKMRYFQIRIVNTWKKIWGEDAEEYDSLL